MFHKSFQVKQYIAEVYSKRNGFKVFRTGDPKFYLFCQMDKTGCDAGLHIPVLKRRLQRNIARGLANGWGYKA